MIYDAYVEVSKIVKQKTNPRLLDRWRFVIVRKPVEKYVIIGSHRRIVNKMAKPRFSYTHDLSLFTVFFDISPHQLAIVDSRIEMFFHYIL